MNQIKLVVLDVDGVMTDGKKYYTREGKIVMKQFCDKDWTAIKRFKAIDIPVICLTGDKFNQAVAEKRNIETIISKTEKHKVIANLVTRFKITYDQIAYVGDDIYDIQTMKQLKYAFCPMDVPDIVEKECTVLQVRGGDNVVVALLQELEEQKLITIPDVDAHIEKVYAQENYS